MTIVNGYATTDDLGDIAEAIDAAGTALVPALERVIESSSRAVDAYCRRRFFSNGTAEVRVYKPVSCEWLDIDDLATNTFILKTSSALNRSYDVTWSTDDFQTEPLNNVRFGSPWPTEKLVIAASRSFTVASIPTVQVTGQFSFGTACPTEVHEATVMKSLRLLKRHDSPTGVQSGEYGPVYISRKTDPDICDLIDKYRKGGGVGVA